MTPSDEPSMGCAQNPSKHFCPDGQACTPPGPPSEQRKTWLSRLEFGEHATQAQSASQMASCRCTDRTLPRTAATQLPHDVKGRVTQRATSARATSYRHGVAEHSLYRAEETLQQLGASPGHWPSAALQTVRLTLQLARHSVSLPLAQQVSLPSQSSLPSHSRSWAHEMPGCTQRGGLMKSSQHSDGALQNVSPQTTPTEPSSGLPHKPSEHF